MKRMGRVAETLKNTSTIMTMVKTSSGGGTGGDATATNQSAIISNLSFIGNNGVNGYNAVTANLSAIGSMLFKIMAELNIS